MMIHVKKTVEAEQCQKCRKYIKKKNNHKTFAKKNTFFFGSYSEIFTFQTFF